MRKREWDTTNFIPINQISFLKNQDEQVQTRHLGVMEDFPVLFL